MLAGSHGYRLNNADNYSKYSQPEALSKLKNREAGVGDDLEDYQRVGKIGKKQSGTDLDGITKDEARKTAHKEHIEKMFGTGAKDESGKNKDKTGVGTDRTKNKHDGFQGESPLCECETCRSRRYQDQSKDSAVSFQQPTKMNPTKAAQMVKSHEMEHVRREQFKAMEDGKRIISQSVQIKTATCPECHKIYVSGGQTRTQTKHSDPDFIDLFRVGAEDMFKQGNQFSATA